MSGPNFEMVQEGRYIRDAVKHTPKARIPKGARRLGALLTVAGLMTGGVTIQSLNQFNGKVEPGIARCLPEKNDGKCAIKNGTIDMREVPATARCLYQKIRSVTRNSGSSTTSSRSC